MGFFTWTLANRTPKMLKCGTDYAAQCKLRYYGYGAVVCPDNTIIQEPCYEGYGVFDGKDVYDLVVDWNKNYLTDIPKLPGFKPWGDTEAMFAVLKAIQEDDQDALEKTIDAVAVHDPFMRAEWKRIVGIYIACENNVLIPYPIKIVDCVRPKPYNQLRPSISTQ